MNEMTSRPIQQTSDVGGPRVHVTLNTWRNAWLRQTVAEATMNHNDLKYEKALASLRRDATRRAKTKFEETGVPFIDGEDWLQDIMEEEEKISEEKKKKDQDQD